MRNSGYANQQISALIIRGISDLIEGKGEADKGGFQEIAAHHASAFAFQVLAKFEIAIQSQNSNQVQGETGSNLLQNYSERGYKVAKNVNSNYNFQGATSGGGFAGRDYTGDIHTSETQEVYKNCTFIQLLSPDSQSRESLSESEMDLDLSDIPQESIQQAYQDSLPPDAELWGLAGENNRKILQTLERFRRLSQFFERLSQDKNLPLERRYQLFEGLSQDENISPEMRHHLQTIAQKLALKKHPESKNKSSPQSNNQANASLKSYLMATLDPYDDKGNQFLLNAWLITDDPYLSSYQSQDLKRFQSLLDDNEQQAGTLCKLTDVSNIINKFLKKALKLLRCQKYCLTIELFLPSNLMCMDIDRWQISDPVNDICLGIKYPIRLRSLERLNLDYLDVYLSQWLQSWDKVRDILKQELSQDLFEHLQEMDSFNWKLLKIRLKEKIGLKVTCAHPQCFRKDLFRAILQATTPIAIWTRKDIPHVDQVTEINNILMFKPLCDLGESLLKTREKADAEMGEHLGLHLSLLWENPYRLTPDIMVELITTGQ
ncbi:MAG: hypothetical protein AB4041_01660 [Microcystaceae cyanobacterium]